jgi:hypothetical protein
VKFVATKEGLTTNFFHPSLLLLFLDPDPDPLTRLNPDPQPCRNRFQGMNSARARICKRLRRPGIDSEDSIPPAYIAGRAGTTIRVVVPAREAVNRFLGSFKGGLQIRAQPIRRGGPVL